MIYEMKTPIGYFSLLEFFKDCLDWKSLINVLIRSNTCNRKFTMDRVLHRIKGEKIRVVENFSPGIVSLRMNCLSVIELQVKPTLNYGPD